MLSTNNKLVVYSDEDIQCANGMMLCGFITDHKLFGTEYVIEDGMVTEIHYRNIEEIKVIKQK